MSLLSLHFALLTPPPHSFAEVQHVLQAGSVEAGEFPWAGSYTMADMGRFHPKCSSGVELSKDRRVATGKGNIGFVFSNDPIPIGLQFSVKISQKSFAIVSPLSASKPHPSAAPYIV